MNLLSCKRFPTRLSEEISEFVVYQVESQIETLTEGSRGSENKFGVLYDDYSAFVYAPSENDLRILLIEYQQWELTAQLTTALRHSEETK